MATFKYIARDGKGSEQQGTLVADSESAAVRVLDERGLFPVSLSPERVSGPSLGIYRRVRLSELANVYNQLGDLLSAGVPMLRALDVLARHGTGRALSGALRELREDVAGGASLADAMEKHTLIFPELHVGMVRAGEQGGFLEQVLHRLAIFVEQRDDLRNKVIGALIYPAFLLVVGMAVVVLAVTYFMPKLEPLFSGIELPQLTKAVMGFGTMLHNYFLLMLCAVVLAIALILPFFRSAAGRQWWHRVQLRLPVMGKIFLIVAICRFCRVLGTLLSNGVPMLVSLNISRQSAGNTVLAEVIADASEAVRSGESLARTFAESRLFPPEFVDIISVAEQTNRLDAVLVDLADKHEARVSRKLDAAVRMLEPAMLLVVVGMVAVIAVALLLPILRMSALAANF